MGLFGQAVHCIVARNARVGTNFVEGESVGSGEEHMRHFLEHDAVRVVSEFFWCGQGLLEEIDGIEAVSHDDLRACEGRGVQEG